MKKIIILCIAITLFAVLNAQTLVVRPGNPDCYQTIQEAVADCPDGGKVVVYSGIYNEAFHWPSDRNISLLGASKANPPVLECQYSIHFENVNSLNIVKGFKFISHVAVMMLENSNPQIVECIFEGNENCVYINNPINSDEVLIKDCLFRNNASKASGIAIRVDKGKLKVIDSVFDSNSAIEEQIIPNHYPLGHSGAAIYFKGYDLYLENNLFSNNYGTNGGACICINDPFIGDNESNITILNNRFENNIFDLVDLATSPAKDIAIYHANSFEEILIKNNIFYEGIGSDISIIGSNDSVIKYYNNTNYNNTHGYSLLELYGCHADIKNSIFHGLIGLSESASTISNSWIVYQNQAYFTNATTSDIHYGDPQIDPVTLAPIWTSSIKSGLIDAGHIDTNGNGVIWYEDSDDQDIDGTRLDIGAVPATDHGQFMHTLESSGYNWVCFPYLDKLYTDDSYYIADEMYYMLHSYNGNELFLTGTDYRILDKVMWMYNSPLKQQTGYSYNQFTNTSLNLDSRYGFKIQMLNSQPDKDIVTGGFLCGTQNNPEDEITIMAKEPGTQYREIWVGYFKEKSEKPNYALQDIINNPNLIEIKTKYWAMYRTALGWIGNAIMGHPVAFNQGEAVSLKYTGDTDISFRWKTRDDIITPKYVEPETKYFTYEEQADYIPVYVELSEDMVSDEKAELALFIDDVCYGAEVVKGDTIQINAYLEGAPIDTGIVEFRYYNYESKAPTRVINDYLVFHQSAQVFQARDLDFTQNELYYSISFNKTGTQTEMTPTISCLEGNYPNPFNPTTTIKYNIAQKEHIKLQIFNVKGQMINELINDEIEAGFHKVVWNGDDHLGNQVASGVYFYKLETSSHSEMRKMLLMK